MGDKSLFSDIEMFQTSISPLAYHKIDFPDQVWAVETNKYEPMQQQFSLTGFTLELKRSHNPFLTNTYLPTALLTIISFIGFVIPVDIVPGLMGLLVTIFLMLVNISSTERSKGPKVRTIRIFNREC